MVKDFVKILNQVNSEKVPDTLKIPESYNQLLSEMKNNKYSTKDFALILKGMVCICVSHFFHSSILFVLTNYIFRSHVPSPLEMFYIFPCISFTR